VTRFLSSPALCRNRFCSFHKRFQGEPIKLSGDRARLRTGTFVLPVLEDANSIQIALIRVMRQLVSQQIVRLSEHGERKAVKIFASRTSRSRRAGGKDRRDRGIEG